MSLRLSVLLFIFAAAVSADVKAAGPAPFDLSGPTLEVTITRRGTTLTVAQVPNLASGDQLLIRADFPKSQSETYLLVVAFLRGATNPPPQNWFFRCSNRKRECADKGLTATVPDGAQQVLVFLAPETGGDFKTLVNAVRGRPGAFVRATQDLNQATLDRSRLDRYLLAIRGLNDADPSVLRETTPLLARSLGIKVDDKCLDRIPQLQAPCLMQGQESLILNDGHSTSIVEALTSGPASDLTMQAAATPELRYGYYSPYIASIRDLARLFDSFRIANYQYIPALTSARGNKLALTLNTPPSFHDPKSVLVAALPAVEQPQLPPLHAVDPKDIYCARKNSLVLPVQGAPLVFSTEYAHSTKLRLSGKNGEAMDLPATADAEEGGFIVDTSALKTDSLGDRIKGALHGYWGFEKFEGPSFQLVNTSAQPLSLSPMDEGSLIAGRANTIHLQAGSVACIDRIMIKDPAGKELRAEWSPTKANEVQINLPLQGADPGPVMLFVSQFGAREPQPIELRVFPEAGRLEGFAIYAGETRGILKGSRLDEVVSLSLKDLQFVPAVSMASLGNDALLMEVKAAADTNTQPSSLKQGETAKAQVTLRDGRVYSVNVAVAAPRPSVNLLDKSVALPSNDKDSNINLASENQLPQEAQLTFSIRNRVQSALERDLKIEVATEDEAFATTLSFANRGLTLADARVAVATLDPAKAFGSSAFGPLKFRPVTNGVAGDWQPLATLVRLPALQELQCPAEPEVACKLSGFNLFLLESVAGDPDFKQAIQVPEGFPGRALPVPHPRKGKLFLKLRDDPTVINSATLTAQALPKPPAETAPEPAPVSTTPESARSRQETDARGAQAGN